MHVASLRLRLLATLVDAAVAIAGVAALVGMGISGAVLYRRVRGSDGDPHGEEEIGHDDGEDEPDRDVEDEPSGMHCPTRASRRWSGLRGLLWGTAAGLTVASRNWRSPGFRLIGLRRVDARSGGIVSVRGALAGMVFDHVWQDAWTPLFSSRIQRYQARLRALAPQLTAVERENVDDPQARRRAVEGFYKSNAVNPAAGCAWPLARLLVSHLVLALWLRGGRTIRDRVTGTAVIVDR